MRIGVLSVDRAETPAYLAEIASSAGADLVGVWDDDRKLATSVANDAGTRAFTKIADLLQRVDGVVIASPVGSHRRLVELSAAAGLDILCESPIATTMEDAWAIVDTCDRAGIRLMTAQPARWYPALKALESAVRSGALGTPIFLEGVSTAKLPDFAARKLANPESRGGAITYGVACLADLCRWILRSEAVEVYAVANRILQERFAILETGGFVSMRFENGTSATIDCSWSKPRAYPARGELSVSLVGTGGGYRVDAFRQHLAVYGTDEARVSWPSWGPDPKREMTAEFLSLLRDGQELTPTALDGLKVVEIIDAAYRSIAVGAPVQLEPGRS